MKRVEGFLANHYRWIFPCLALAIVSPLFTALDLASARFFFEEGHFSRSEFYGMLYRYGPWPALALFIAATLLLLLSPLCQALKRWRRVLFSLFFTMAIGTGLIVHLVLKENWGRPRPVQVEEFGGKMTFRPFYSPDFCSDKGPAKSFPSGHSSTGFYFFSLALVLRRMDEEVKGRVVFCLALLLGGVIGLARMAQGGHFFSDVVFSGLILWLTALVADWLAYRKKIVG